MNDVIRTSKASDDLTIVTNWQQLLGLIDKVWNAATESEEVPHHEWASRLINDWMPEQPPAHETCDALYATRYRWLRDNGVLVLDETLTGDELDKAVDTERMHAQKASEQCGHGNKADECPHPHTDLR